MLTAVERMISFRYLRARRQEGFVSVITAFSLLGILLGVGTLIVVLSVFNGVRQETLDRVLGVTGTMAVYPVGTAAIDDYAAVSDRIGAVSGVLDAAPMIEGQVLVAGRTGSAGGFAHGIRPRDLARRAAVVGPRQLRAGSLDRFAGTDALIIGSRLADRLGVGVGASVTLISPNSMRTVIGAAVPRMKRFEIVAIFEVGFYSFDESYIYLPLEAAQLFFQLKDRATKIEVALGDPDAVCPHGGSRPGCPQRSALDAAQAGGSVLYSVGDWKQTNSGFFSAVQAQRNVVFLILALIVLVAAFNIVSGMIMLVKEKAREVAILRTMGMGRVAVMRIFFASGAAVGLVGTLGGLGLGVLVAGTLEDIRQFLQAATGVQLFPADIYNLYELPTVVRTEDIVAVGLMGVVLSFVATLYPAWRAARLDPVEVLRYE